VVGKNGFTLYVATVDWGGVFTKNPEPLQFTVNAHYYGGAVAPDPRDPRGWLQAVDASTGKECWKRPQGQSPCSLGAAVRWQL
jgi:glucose dehydrogenase